MSQKYLQRRIQLLKNRVPFNPQLKLDKRAVSAPHGTQLAATFLMINGMLYKSSNKTAVKPASMLSSGPQKKGNEPVVKKLDVSSMKMVTVRGVRFRVDMTGKKLQRISPARNDVEDRPRPTAGPVSRVDIGGEVYVQTQPGTLERVGSVKSRVAAIRVRNKTVQRAAVTWYKKDNARVIKKKKYCMFYNRFGKCNHKEKCPYIHDPEKVAVCTRFLRGTCKVKDCLFSHTVSKDKMPVCSYFLKGVCNRDDCPYLHVNVNRDAEVCVDFLRGFCSLGEKCKKKHVLKCPEFDRTGVCSNADKCKLQHRKPQKRKNQSLGKDGSAQSKKLKSDLTSGTEDLYTSNGTSSMYTTVTEEGVPVADRHEADSAKFPEKQLRTGSHAVHPKASMEDGTITFKEQKLPAYISLKIHESQHAKISDDIIINKVAEKEKPLMKIRPQLT